MKNSATHSIFKPKSNRNKNKKGSATTKTRKWEKEKISYNSDHDNDNDYDFCINCMTLSSNKFTLVFRTLFVCYFSPYIIIKDSY